MHNYIQSSRGRWQNEKFVTWKFFSSLVKVQIPELKFWHDLYTYSTMAYLLGQGLPVFCCVQDLGVICCCQFSGLNPKSTRGGVPRLLYYWKMGWLGPIFIIFQKLLLYSYLLLTSSTVCMTFSLHFKWWKNTEPHTTVNSLFPTRNTGHNFWNGVTWTATFFF